MENGMSVYHPHHLRGQLALARQKLTREDLDIAIQRYEESENVTCATRIGINDDGFFFSHDANWSPEQPNAFRDPIGMIPWSHLHELLATAS